MKVSLKSLRMLLGRVWCDLDRKLNRQDALQSARAASILARVKRLLEQRPKDKNKLHSLHAPKVECIAKGKARQPYEFGVKATIAATHLESLITGMRSLSGNLFDGHTLARNHQAGGDPRKAKAEGDLCRQGLPGGRSAGRQGLA